MTKNLRTQVSSLKFQSFHTRKTPLISWNTCWIRLTWWKLPKPNWKDSPKWLCFSPWSCALPLLTGGSSLGPNKKWSLFSPRFKPNNPKIPKSTTGLTYKALILRRRLRRCRKCLICTTRRHLMISSSIKKAVTSRSTRFASSFRWRCGGLWWLKLRPLFL